MLLCSLKSFFFLSCGFRLFVCLLVVFDFEVRLLDILVLWFLVAARSSVVLAFYFQFSVRFCLADYSIGISFLWLSLVSFGTTGFLCFAH